MSTQYTFIHFKHRESTFAVVAHLWQCHVNGVAPPAFGPDSVENLAGLDKSLPIEALSQQQQQRVDSSAQTKVPASMHAKLTHRRGPSKDDSYLSAPAPRSVTRRPSLGDKVVTAPLQKTSTTQRAIEEEKSSSRFTAEDRPSILRRWRTFGSDDARSRKNIGSKTSLHDTSRLSNSKSLREKGPAQCDCTKHYKFSMIDETFDTSLGAFLDLLFNPDSLSSMVENSILRQWADLRHARLLHVSDWYPVEGGGTIAGSIQLERKLIYELSVTDKLAFFFPDDSSLPVTEWQRWQYRREDAACVECTILLPEIQSGGKHGADSKSTIDIHVRYCMNDVPLVGKCHVVATANIVFPNNPKWNALPSSTLSNYEVKLAHVLFMDIAVLVDLVVESIEKTKLFRWPSRRKSSERMSITERASRSSSDVSLPFMFRLKITFFRILVWAPVSWLLYFISLPFQVIYSILFITYAALSQVIYFRFGRWLQMVLFYGSFPIFLHVEDSYIRISRWYQLRVSSKWKDKRLWMAVLVWILLSLCLIWVAKETHHTSVGTNQPFFKHDMKLQRKIESIRQYLHELLKKGFGRAANAFIANVRLYADQLAVGWWW